MLQQKMKPRHLTMIAVGGSIGTGLFVGSGAALNAGGPAGVLIDWVLMGVMLVNITQALGEMSIMYPLSGGYYTLAGRFVDPSWAFAMGWNYVFSWVVTLPLEITVAVTTVNYWPNSVPVAGWITIFWVVIILLSILGTLGFAEEEFWSSCLKLLVIVMFIFIGIICICGGGPASGEFGHYVGGSTWQDPGAFANGFKGVCSVFVTAAFAFAGTELVGLAASETPDPRAVMPGAVKGTFWRIILVFVVSLTIVGLMVPYDDDRLLNGSGSAASPFVIALVRANISGVDHLLNAVICISVLSVGLSCVYAGSRTLTALAETGYAPKIFTYVDKSSRPLWSVVLILAFGAIAYVNVGSEGDTVFDWLLALSGLSTLFTWLSICVCHIRFRAAWKAQGHSLEELPFRALGGAWGSWFGATLIVLVLIAQFYIAVWPIGGMSDNGQEVAENFFQVYMAMPIVLAFWIGGYAWKRERPRRASEIDLDTGRKSFFTVEEMRAYRAERANAPLHVRVWRTLFSN
ncbi:amino acid permease/ SLC12A domain-containing protein [Schizophyllum amplum]|uniref:Amino acid permease/ SLC12A domain-containing protein n=1 Tax=Schizophyllum amplum TaxID=97359 RepID=A0A550C821_9AGAR|nr:amino acid permease/ SLC12A domain-containing protein [Auriculariopsis ampla]